MDKALFLIDPLKDFYDKLGALFGGPTFLDSIPFMVARAREYVDNGKQIFLIGDSHADDDLEFKRFPSHAVAGIWGAEAIKELVGLPYIYVPKTRYSGFYKTRLDNVLEKCNVSPETHIVEIAGCCTHICVMDTIGGLANRDFQTVLHRKAVADFDQEAAQAALKRMTSLYGTEVL